MVSVTLPSGHGFRDLIIRFSVMVSVTENAGNRDRDFLLECGSSASLTQLLRSLVLLGARFFGDLLRLFEGGNATPFVRWGDAVLLVYVGQPETVRLPVSADAGMASVDLEESEGFTLSNSGSDGVTVDSPLLELAARNNELAVFGSAMRHVLRFNAVHHKNKGLAPDTQRRALDHLSGVANPLLADLALALGLADLASNSF
jgi:hypothetical protein